MDRIPGLIWDVIAAHPLLCIVGAATVATILYIAVLRLFFALEDVRDVRDQDR